MAKLNPATLHVRMPEEMLAELRTIAAQQYPPEEAAALLRWAAAAIIDSWRQDGHLPDLMRTRLRAGGPALKSTLGRLSGDPQLNETTRGADYPTRHTHKKKQGSPGSAHPLSRAHAGEGGTAVSA